jgi:hypothetical protein
MKKKYITPEAYVLNIETHHMLATSQPSRWYDEYSDQEEL